MARSGTLGGRQLFSGTVAENDQSDPDHIYDEAKKEILNMPAHKATGENIDPLQDPDTPKKYKNDTNYCQYYSHLNTPDLLLLIIIITDNYKYILNNY